MACGCNRRRFRYHIPLPRLPHGRDHDGGGDDGDVRGRRHRGRDDDARAHRAPHRHRGGDALPLLPSCRCAQLRFPESILLMWLRCSSRTCEC